jgi:hypothetical protein
MTVKKIRKNVPAGKPHEEKVVRTSKVGFYPVSRNLNENLSLKP